MTWHHLILFENNPLDYENENALRPKASQWTNGNGRTVFMIRAGAWGARSNILPRTKDFRFPRYFPQYAYGTKFNRHLRDEKRAEEQMRAK